MSDIAPYTPHSLPPSPYGRSEIDNTLTDPRHRAIADLLRLHGAKESQRR